MTSGTAIALAVLTAYIGFEAYAIRKASHRTEPAYIYNMLAESRTAAALCNFGDPELLERFDRTLSKVKQQYRDDLADKNPEFDAAAIDEVIAETSALAENQVKQFYQQNDCLHETMTAHNQRIKIYARRSR